MLYFCIHLLLVRFVEILFGDNWSYVFFVRSFGCALFLFLGDFMTEKELIWKMYTKLFNTITDVLPLVENTKTAEILKQAQIATEEMYIEIAPFK